MALARTSWLLLAALLSACEADPPPPAPLAPPPEAGEPGIVRLLGTGAMTALASLLAAEWSREHPELKIVVEPSVGSGGGVRAAADGAVELGMISRPLSASEQALGLDVVPIARDAVVIAAHPGIGIDGLSIAELEALYAGRSEMFGDGTRAVVLLRDAQESANLALERWLPAIEVSRKQAYKSRRLRVLYHDDAMGSALASTPGAIGVFSLGAAQSLELRLRVLSIGGVRPSVESMADGSWQATRDLAFVVRPDRAQRARPFVEFARSAEAHTIMRASGYLPLTEAGSK
jgi:phosphate transport system substrate-binding protein